ncbi:hypothetical protein [Streptomyces canus]|uniref:hypothetical protein n=1 Tax=Streptomyces canus TaxID=58343 RepID=UPI00371A2F16
MRRAVDATAVAGILTRGVRGTDTTLASVAVLPSSWTRLARRCGAVVAPIETTAHLHVAMVSLPAHLTPAARAFLALTRPLADRRARKH